MKREEFDRRLRSIVIPEGTPVSEINRMVLPIREAIVEMMPHSLFRYRNCDQNHINAFETDEIFTVPADWFNDPYDTLVRYDYDLIKKYVKEMVSIEGLSQMKSFITQGNDFPAEVKQMLPDEFWGELKTRIMEITDIGSFTERLENSKGYLLSLVSTYFPILSFFGKRFSTMACFSEDIQSILMWSHYSDSHKGFALEYDFRSTLKNPISGVGIYPVIYSEDRFDASPFLLWGLFTIMGIKAKNPDIMASTKAALYKSKLWEYEKEWRMIDAGPHDIMNPSASTVYYRPAAIYYGQKIDDKIKSRLHSIAATKGIKEYEMVIDYASPSYEMNYKPYE